MGKSSFKANDKTKDCAEEGGLGVGAGRYSKRYHPHP